MDCTGHGLPGGSDVWLTTLHKLNLTCAFTLLWTVQSMVYLEGARYGWRLSTGPDGWLCRLSTSSTRSSNWVARSSLQHRQTGRNYRSFVDKVWKTAEKMPLYRIFQMWQWNTVGSWLNIWSQPNFLIDEHWWIYKAVEKNHHYIKNQVYVWSVFKPISAHWHNVRINNKKESSIQRGKMSN